MTVLPPARDPSTPRRRVAWPAIGLAALLALGGCRRVDRDELPSPQAIVHPSPGSDPARALPSPPVVIPDFATVAQALRPAVVTVVATVPQSGGRGSKVVRGLGSGVLVSADGQVVTNEHVVASATRIDVELSAGRRYPARVIVAEPMVDLALLQLEGALHELVPVTFAERVPSPGTWVMAVGQPFGLGHTVTVGVVSGLQRDHDDLGRPEGLRPDGLWSFIQTDASINVGNSGGPLVDVQGRVVGITTAVRNDGQGLAFAIPSAMVRRFLEETRLHGRFRLARIGIKAENVITPDLPGTPAAAVRVTGVSPDGPAARAGLDVGDILLEVGDAPVQRVSDVAYRTQLVGVDAPLPITFVDAQTAEPARVVLVPSEAS